MRIVVGELQRGFRDGTAASDLYKVIDAMPGELNDLYERAYERIENDYRVEGFAMMMLVLCCPEPFSPEELICCIDVSTGFLDNRTFGMFPERVSTTAAQRRLQSRSGGLLETNPRTTLVQFLHQTTHLLKKYFGVLCDPKWSSLEANRCENGHGQDCGIIVGHAFLLCWACVGVDSKVIPQIYGTYPVSVLKKMRVTEIAKKLDSFIDFDAILEQDHLHWSPIKKTGEWQALCNEIQATSHMWLTNCLRRLYYMRRDDFDPIEEDFFGIKHFRTRTSHQVAICVFALRARLRYVASTFLLLQQPSTSMKTCQVSMNVRIVEYPPSV